MRKTTVFASLRLSLKMRNGELKEEVNESQKEGVRVRNRGRRWVDAGLSQTVIDCVKQHSWSSSISHQ